MDIAELFRKVVRPRVEPKLALTLTFTIDDSDADEELETEGQLDTISGLAVVIEYVGADGARTQRLITCRKLSERARQHYVSAFCHERKSVRNFRVDRVETVCDPSTGEVLGSGNEFFAHFKPDNIANSGLTWGLSPTRRADLLAFLTVLVFVARCDQEFHPLEQDSLEGVIGHFWIRLNLPGDPDVADIMKYTNRLAPDGEAFWLSVVRLRSNPELVPLLRYSMREVIDADGHQHQAEFVMAKQVEEFLAE